MIAFILGISIRDIAAAVSGRQQLASNPSAPFQQQHRITV